MLGIIGGRGSAQQSRDGTPFGTHRTAVIRTPERVSVGEDGDRLELGHAAGGKAKRCGHCGDSLAIPQKKPKRNENLCPQRNLDTNVDSSTIQHGHKGELSPTPLTGEGQTWVVHPCNKVIGP